MHLSTAIERAYHRRRAAGIVDEELDLGGHDPAKPKIGNHWARRKADKEAMDTAEQTDTEMDTINEYFGWNQAEMKQASQHHYAGSTRLLKLARVTMML